MWQIIYYGMTQIVRSFLQIAKVRQILIYFFMFFHITIRSIVVEWSMLWTTQATSLTPLTWVRSLIPTVAWSKLLTCEHKPNTTDIEFVLWFPLLHVKVVDFRPQALHHWNEFVLCYPLLYGHDCWLQTTSLTPLTWVCALIPTLRVVMVVDLRPQA